MLVPPVSKNPIVAATSFHSAISVAAIFSENSCTIPAAVMSVAVPDASCSPALAVISLPLIVSVNFELLSTLAGVYHHTSGRGWAFPIHNFVATILTPG